jgi:rfaE bifunctional protein nucleotidyltransferase chain/domain
MWNVSLAFIFHHNVAQIEDKDQPQISQLKIRLPTIHPGPFGTFPRLFARLTHSSRLIGKGMSAKIVGLEELSERSKQLQAAGKKLVATNGCFDLLHVGHVRYLQAARALGDLLAVGLNRDRSVRELKGKGRPITAERDRAEILAALQCVDLVTIFPELRATQFIAASHPAIYVKGGDYTSETLNEEERTVLKEIGAEIRIIPFEAGYSTSRLLEQICEDRP